MSRANLIGLIMIAAAAALYIQSELKKDSDLAGANQNDYPPDFIATQLKSRVYDETGKLNSRVQARSMEHYQALNLTIFERPTYSLYPNEGQSHWQLGANIGTLYNDTQQVMLEDQVVINAISPNEPIKSINTSYIELSLGDMIMTSNRSLTIQGDDFELQGLGLKADLNANTVNLLSQVEGTYYVE
ncbi:LPS export ABC transporter periplasmic protein LptC [Paraferrimonas sedimenticola]|uniref:Lipopolysaccharide export system protein LptC n=1 Tax=Paraferrimonas sedimenticola TaxID=375674 RepID=A0AA37RV53_9GAMM|nr:LPS export ABC transporter periplasmic protein LptC [Paraferrimonas sedimenticola]GLP95828.1 hypothetical protein GCM10007895_11340 [Paraferrimonas sedimenticola]